MSKLSSSKEPTLICWGDKDVPDKIRDISFGGKLVPASKGITNHKTTLMSLIR